MLSTPIMLHGRLAALLPLRYGCHACLKNRFPDPPGACASRNHTCVYAAGGVQGLFQIVGFGKIAVLVPGATTKIAFAGLQKLLEALGASKCVNAFQQFDYGATDGARGRGAPCHVRALQ